MNLEIGPILAFMHLQNSLQGDFYFLTVAGQFWQTRLSQYLMNRARLVNWAQ